MYHKLHKAVLVKHKNLEQIYKAHNKLENIRKDIESNEGYQEILNFLTLIQFNFKTQNDIIYFIRNNIKKKSKEEAT